MVNPRSNYAYELVVEIVFPLNVSIGIAVFINSITIQLELVPAIIARKVNAVFSIHNMTDMQVQVIEGS